MAHPHWPMFDLEVRTPRLTLRYVDDELAVALADLAAKGIHDPGYMPFARPWTDAPPGELERNTLQFHWRSRAELTPDAWHLLFAVVADGDVVGCTGLTAEAFPLRRTFETGSWLGKEFQGRGLGKELRQAALHLGFAGLEAQVATTEAFSDNAPSLGVTRTLGYEPNGVSSHVRRAEAGEIFLFRMTRQHWETIRRPDIEVTGVDAVRPLLGL